MFWDAGGGLAPFTAEIEEGSFEAAVNVPFCSAREMVRVWVKTPCGSLELVRAADGPRSPAAPSPPPPFLPNVLLTTATGVPDLPFRTILSILGRVGTRDGKI